MSKVSLSREEIRQMVREELAALKSEWNAPRTPATEPEPELLNVKQAADFLRVSEWTIYQYISKGRLTNIKRGKRVYFDVRTLRAYVAENGYTRDGITAAELQAQKGGKDGK